MDLNTLNDRYKSDEGDALAIAELTPVVQHHLHSNNPKILEIGCGYGRNLVALAAIPEALVTGCDFSAEELAKAEEKLAGYGITNVILVHQKNERVLPFENNSFDFIVLWQVLEHVLSTDKKKALLEEAARVLKDGGKILIETPNFLFPFDYHDNNLPLVHWLLSDNLRYKITRKVRKEDFPPSQYTTLFEINRFLRKAPGVTSIKQVTHIYFEKSYLDIFRNLGGTRVRSKIIFFTLYFPIYVVLRVFRLPADLFTPSIRIVTKISKGQ
jgi:ubiquinone/menaquinone biosynthesis C-methylase UbiE